MDRNKASGWLVAIILILIGFGGIVFFTEVRAEDVPVPKLAGRVTDLASALSPDQKSKLEAQLKDLEQFPNKPQVAVLIVNTTGDDGIDAFKVKVFNTWKLGNAETNNGLLTVLAVKDRKMGTEVGYGNEPYFTDGRMAKIRVDIMTPFLKKGEWYNALAAETAEFKKIFAANPEEQIAKPVDTQKAANNANQHSSGHGVLLLLLFALIVVGAIVWFLKREKRDYTTRSGTPYRPDYDRDDYTSSSFPPSYGTKPYQPNPPTPTRPDHTVRDSAIGGFAGGVAGGIVGSEISKRRRDDDDDYRPSRSSSTVTDSGGISGSTSWGSSDSSSSSSSSSSSDSSSSYSGDGGSSGGGGDSGGW